jgi:3-methyladenine DNA glycosylase AlkD
MIDVEAERRRLLDQIKQRADPEYQAGNMMVMHTRLKMYGVRVPHLREIARGWERDHRRMADEDTMALMEALWAGESQEERMLALLILSRSQRCISRLTWDHFDRWRRGLDNWGLTDGLATGILGPWLLGDAARLSHLSDLIADADVWSRRLALVATVPLNRGQAGVTFPDLTLALIDRVKQERHPMITKAVSWALREMAKNHPDQVAAYLTANRDSLAAHVVREVNNKLRTGLKSGKVKR